jgi:hypothetical protein
MLFIAAVVKLRRVEAMRMRFIVLASLSVSTGATAVALMIHRALGTCAYLVAQPGSACPSSATDYPLRLRIAIIVAGILTAGLIAILGGVRPYSRSGHLRHQS